MARMRTVKAAIEHIKQQDPNSCISEWWVRQLIKQNKLKHHKAGNKILIDLDYFEQFLREPIQDDVQEETQEYGKLRKVKG